MSVNYVQIIDGIADVLETTADYVRVVRDPIFSREQADYARLLKGDDEVVDGWLVTAGPEEAEEARGADGADQYATFDVVAICTVNPNRSPSGSLAYFGGKVQQAKDAFRETANKDLGISESGTTVRQYGLYAPGGYVTASLGTEKCHIADMQIRVFVSTC